MDVHWKGCISLVLFLLCALEVKAVLLGVPITILENAVAKGAVCLDGSPPAYHLERGSGAGVNNWFVDIEGGGWCQNVSHCLARKTMHLGSSKHMAVRIGFQGILGGKREYNPDFYNWNRVRVRYCDGASFTGDVEEVDPVHNLYFRGARIWSAIMEDLLAKGMDKAENALLSGCSAGGLTTILHCDNFKALLPATANVKCISDAGFFLNAPDITGANTMEGFFDAVAELQGSAKHLSRSCTSVMKPSLCFFPQYIVQDVETPLFVLNSAYDHWQIRNILVPSSADPLGEWNKCKTDISLCSLQQIETLEGFRFEFLKAVAVVKSKPTNGLFICSCFLHCQAAFQQYWLGVGSTQIENVGISQAVGDWFYGRSSSMRIGSPYPTDPFCRDVIQQKPCGCTS